MKARYCLELLDALEESNALLPDGAAREMTMNLFVAVEAAKLFERVQGHHQHATRCRYKTGTDET